MNEIWKDVPEYEGHYQVSNYGIVKSIDRYWITVRGKKHIKKSVILKHEITWKGYKKVTLCMNNRPKKYFIHRIVMMAFNPTTDKKMQVNHIDGNKSNNRIDNLEWVTCSENNRHAFKLGLNRLDRTHNNNCKLDENKVKDIRSNVKTYKDYKKYCLLYGVCEKTIYDVVSRRRWNYADL